VDLPNAHLGGRIIGTWSGEKKKETFLIQLNKHEPLNSKQKEGILHEAEHIGAFLRDAGEGAI